MRVLVANNYFYLRGGSERVMFNDMNALADRGVEVIPFSAVDPANVPNKFAPYFAQGVDVHATGPLDQVRAAGESIHCQRTARAFDALIEKSRPDVVHFHNVYGRLSTSILKVTRRRRLPAVLTVHDYKMVCPSYLMLRNGRPCQSCADGGFYRCTVYRCHKRNFATSAVSAIEAYYARLTDSYGAVSRFLCPSQFLGELLVRSGIDAQRVLYHPNAIDTRTYTPSYEGHYVLYVGRLSAEKGLPTLIKAIAGTTIPLRIAGTGPMEAELRTAVEVKRGSVVLEGHCGGQRLEDLYKNAAFVVVPSEWYENAPMTVLEAFAYGKPVVATRIGGIPELVSEGETGYLADVGRPDQLRSAICNLWTDLLSRETMGRNARKLVETKFSQMSRIDSLLNIYTGLCGVRELTSACIEDPERLAGSSFAGH